jgi:hypothetical protein
MTVLFPVLIGPGGRELHRPGPSLRRPAWTVALAMLAAACATSAVSPSTPGTTASPARINSPSVARPAPRNGFGMAYDIAHHETVWFSGPIASNPTSETWAWNGRRWLLHHPAQSPTYDLTLGYDSARNQIVGFGYGGRLSEAVPSLPSGETWIWDGQTWAQRKPITNPPARGGTSFAWDRKRNRLIMYGGYGRPNEGLYDTWAWDGSDWHALASNPTDFGFLAGETAYYSPGDKVVQYHWAGGIQSDPSQRFMWIFDGSAWNKRTTGTAEMPTSGPLVYDEQLGKLLLFGQRPDPASKYSGSGAATWTWDGATWTHLNTDSGPQARSYPQAVYDSARKRVVLFGGYQLVNDAPVQQNDTWEFDGRTWMLAL